MKIKMKSDYRDLKAGTTHTIKASLAGNLMASKRAEEVGVNELSISTLGRLNLRQLRGIAMGRNIDGCLSMNHGSLVAAIINKKTKQVSKKTVKKTAKKTEKKKVK